MSIDLEQIEKRCAAATAGPWKWRENDFRPRYMQQMRNGNWRARPGRKANDSWVFLLVAPSNHEASDDKDELARQIERGRIDEYDFRHIFALRWNQVRGNNLWNATPSEADCAFIEASRTDIPELVAEVKRLRARVAELEAAE